MTTDQHDKYFVNQTDRYGLLPWTAVPPILKALSLPHQLTETDDYGKADSALNGRKRMVLVVSFVNLTKGNTDPLNHCSVLHAISSGGFSLWTPFQDGSEGVLPPFTVARGFGWAGLR